jgi:hypothetical protein
MSSVALRCTHQGADCAAVCAACSRKKKHIIIIRKTLTPTSEQLSRLPLRPGSNTITFRCVVTAGGHLDCLPGT